jgi:hypothetical protein
MERGAQDLGEWGLVVRVVADWEPARIRERLLWPLRDLLLAYLSILKREALDRYHHDLEVWAMLAPHQKTPGSPPRPPRILKS